jgi:undecaprenyl-diphosphatase
MTIFQAIIQGIVQGLTEFLPVSSSGHLSIVQHFFGVNGESGVLFSILLHVATLLAVFIAFRKLICDLLVEFGRIIRDLFTGKLKFKTGNPTRHMVYMIIISLVPMVFAYFLKDFYEGLAADSDIVVEGICFLITAVLMFLSQRWNNGSKTALDLTPRDALIVGCVQAIAPLPGISRSGSTISAGLFCGMERETAVQFSFIMGMPAVLASALVELKDIGAESFAGTTPAALIIGFLVALVVGLAAIAMVKWIVSNNQFKIFGIYLSVLGGIVLILGIVEHAMGITVYQWLFQ